MNKNSHPEKWRSFFFFFFSGLLSVNPTDGCWWLFGENPSRSVSEILRPAHLASITIPYFPFLMLALNFSILNVSVCLNVVELLPLESNKPIELADECIYHYFSLGTRYVIVGKVVVRVCLIELVWSVASLYRADWAVHTPSCNEAAGGAAPAVGVSGLWSFPCWLAVHGGVF